MTHPLANRVGYLRVRVHSAEPEPFGGKHGLVVELVDTAGKPVDSRQYFVPKHAFIMPADAVRAVMGKGDRR